MSDFGLMRDDEDLGQHPEEPRRLVTPAGVAGRASDAAACPALLVLLLIGRGPVFAGSYGYDELKAHFAAAPDYAGPGTGSVLYQVKTGDTVAAIGSEPARPTW